MARTSRRTAFASILVPIDFSPGARRAARRAASLPLAARGQMHLVHVLPTRAGIAGAKLESQANRKLARVARLMAKVAHAAGRKSPSVVVKSLAGEPHVEIIRYAREVDADLIVLGRKGAGLNMAKVIGTTAARVVRMSDTPVLVVGARPQRPYARPIIALPLDPSARRLVELAMRTVQSGSNPIPAVRAYRVPFSGFVSLGTDAQPSLHHRQYTEEAETALAAQVGALVSHGIRVTPILRRGEASSVILQEARRERADLIALGTHARSGIAHALLGSVAEWVVTNSTSDVLIARPVRFTFEAP